MLRVVLENKKVKFFQRYQMKTMTTIYESQTESKLSSSATRCDNLLCFHIVNALCAYSYSLDDDGDYNDNNNNNYLILMSSKMQIS